SEFKQYFRMSQEHCGCSGKSPGSQISRAGAIGQPVLRAGATGSDDGIVTGDTIIGSITHDAR
ncbi:MAG TPA: hypothetical protein VNR40_00215, partial [Steroidobacter sp.]|nr:hypothetical protein [Steroidobacter sp.]